MNNRLKKILIKTVWLIPTNILVFGAFNAHAFDNEIVQAKEAAPAHITQNASYRVWEDDRFVEKIKGTNEFTCLVLVDGKGRYEPSCLNQAAMKSVLPVYEYQTRMLAQGESIHTIYKNIEAKAKTGEFPKPESGALVYMMSPKNTFYDHFSDKLMDIPAHVMLYLPKVEASSLGFNGQDGLPMFYDEYPHMSVIHIHTDKPVSSPSY